MNVIVASDAQGRDDQRKCAVLKSDRSDGNVDVVFFHAFLEWDLLFFRDASTTQPEETGGSQRSCLLFLWDPCDTL